MARLESENLYELIAHKKGFRIPIYQRNYDWNDKDVKKFFEDIYANFQRHKEKNYDRDDAKYYIGNIIVYDDLKKDSDILMVVDGQQRITSTIIIFASIRKILKNLYDSNKNIDSTLKVKYDDLIYKVEKVTSQNTRDQTKIKLTSIENDDLLEKLCFWNENEKVIIESNEKWKSSNIYCNFLAITKYITNKINVLKHSEFEDIINFFEKDVIKSFSHTLIALIKIFAEKDQPSKIFEIVNTTGKKLKPSDLIKSYIFFFAHDQMTVLSQSYISHVESKIKELKAYADLSEWYRHMISIFHSEHFLYSKTKNNGLEIFYGFKDAINNDKNVEKHKNIFNRSFDFENFDETEEFVQILIKYAKVTTFVYELIKSDKQSNKQIIYNKIIENAWNTYYPLIHTLVMDLFAKDENNKNEFICTDEKKVIEEINNVARLVMHTSLNGVDQKNLTRGPATLHSRYNKEIKEKNENISFWEWMKRNKEDEVQISAFNKEKLRDMIKTSNIYQTSKSKAKIMLAAIEGYSTNFETSLNELLDDYEVEHIFPVNPSQEAEKEYYDYFTNKDDAKDFYSRIRHTLGNLTLVTPEANKKLKNDSWSNKKEIYSNESKLKLNNNLSQYEKWDEESYNSRINSLVEHLVSFLSI
ncbi:MAG: DUF262 domain-containing protein [Mycoplasmoidaceae bacterium]